MTTDNEKASDSLSDILNTDTEVTTKLHKSFRFISGNYVGAALRLCIGTHTLGNTQSCEIVCGIKTTPVEVVIDIQEDGLVKIRLISGTAFVDGNILSLDDEIIMSEGMVLQIGLDSLVWLIDENNFSETWKFVSSSELDEMEKKITEQVLSQKLRDEQERELANENIQKTIEQENTENNELSETSIVDSSKQITEKVTLRKKILAIVGVIILLALLVAMTCGPWIESTRKQNIQNNLEKYVTSFEPGRLKYETDGYTPIVSGLVPDEQALEKFRNGLPTDFEGPIELKITLNTDLFKYLKDSFSSYGVTVTPRENQESFYVGGYIHDNVAEAETIVNVQRDFNKYGPIISEMKYADVMEKELKKLQKKENFDFPAVFGRAMIGYEGEFSLEEQHKLASIKKGLEDFTGAEIDFRPFTEFTNLELDYLASLQKEEIDTTKKIDINLDNSNEKSKKEKKEFSVKSIASINVGNVSFITLKNGYKYFVGGKLPDGSYLRKINKNSLTVEVDGVGLVINVE